MRTAHDRPRHSARLATPLAGWLALAAYAAIIAPGVATADTTATTGTTAPAPRSTRATAPAAPQQLRATLVSTNQVRLRWRADDTAVRYLVYRNGNLAGTGTRARFTDTDVGWASSYTYRVRSQAQGGALSNRSLPVPVSTRHGGGCTKFAATGGDDAWPGTADQPYRTVGKLVSTFGPGVVGCLQGHFDEDVSITRTGSGGAPAVLRNRPGYTPTLHGRLWISDAANDVVVQGLHLDGRNMTGDDLPSPTVEGDRVRLLHNDITNHRTAICVILGSIRGYGQARGAVVDSNRIHGCGVRPAQNHHHGIYLENTLNARITNNVIFANADRGIQLYPNSQGSMIARNVIDGNGEGITFSGAEGYASSNNRAYDNFITNSRLRYNIEYWWADGNPVGTGNLATRNCLWNGAWGDVATPTVGLTARNNTSAKPSYRNRGGGDFRPTAASQCRSLLAPALPLVAW